MTLKIMAAIAAFAVLVSVTTADAKRSQSDAGPVTQFDGDRVRSTASTEAQEASNSARSRRRAGKGQRRYTAPPAMAGAGIVRSQSGITVRVSPSAASTLQCVVNHVEAAGVKIKAMRGYGPGTVAASLHPSGRALDINQTARNITRPSVPRSVSNAAADKCGVISGARWGYADNGHWNLAIHGRTTQEPWPRVIGIQ